MKKQNEIAAINEQHWEKMVQEGCGFTLPWLNLNRNLIQKYINGQLEPVPEPLIDIYPADILQNIQGKDVLCLASGGGQQSVIFGLLGAKVTVADISEGQLKGDQKAAAHYGYKVSTLKTDMRDLSPLKDNYFDLIYQAPSMAYIPDVHEVYSEVARILRKGGLYRVNFSNPATEFVDCEDWDEKGYRITRPYTERIRQTNSRGDIVIEFKHYLSNIFNGLIKSGLIIQQVAAKSTLLRKKHRCNARLPLDWLRLDYICYDTFVSLLYIVVFMAYLIIHLRDHQAEHWQK